MLDNFIENSQFIIVTHNKRTMGRADVIYGVTMQEFGVSKPVGVRMTQDEGRASRSEKARVEAEAAAEEAHHATEEAVVESDGSDDSDKSNMSTETPALSS
jgi:chromosome segregation protein